MKKLLLPIIIIVFIISGVLLFTDVFYQLKYWAKNLNNDKTEWYRDEYVEDDNYTYRLELTSPTFKIDQVYPSMTGPSSIHSFVILEKKTPELVWMTGYETSVIDIDNKSTLDEAFLCHNNLDYRVADYYKYWGINDRINVLIPRLMTITQGVTDINFPDGYGIPLMSDQNLSTATQALNLNSPGLNIDVKHKVTVDYVKESDANQSIKPLFQQSVVLLKDVDTSTNKFTTNEAQVDCRPALASLKFLSQRENGQLFTGHWIIPHGYDTSSYNVTEMLALPYNTTLHYAAVHVHPFCEFLELKDLTTGETVFKSTIKNSEKEVKMEEIGVYSSSKGKMLNKEHEYELVCVTNNTSNEEKDMMAVMLLYLHDKEMNELVKNY